jgi:hypothetical protein
MLTDTEKFRAKCKLEMILTQRKLEERIALRTAVILLVLVPTIVGGFWYWAIPKVQAVVDCRITQRETLDLLEVQIEVFKSVLDGLDK